MTDAADIMRDVPAVIMTAPSLASTVADRSATLESKQLGTGAGAGSINVAAARARLCGRLPSYTAAKEAAAAQAASAARAQQPPGPAPSTSAATAESPRRPCSTTRAPAPSPATWPTVRHCESSRLAGGSSQNAVRCQTGGKWLLATPHLSKTLALRPAKLSRTSRTAWALVPWNAKALTLAVVRPWPEVPGTGAWARGAVTAREGLPSPLGLHAVWTHCWT